MIAKERKQKTDEKNTHERKPDNWGPENSPRFAGKNQPLSVGNDTSRHCPICRQHRYRHNQARKRQCLIELRKYLRLPCLYLYQRRKNLFLRSSPRPASPIHLTPWRPESTPKTAMKQINGMKYCPACHHTHTTDNYSRNKNASDGYYLYCKTCSRKIMKEYDARHKFRPIASAFNSKARRLGLPGILTAADLQSVYDAQGGYCQNCKTDLLIQFDHIVSFWMRGDNLPDNLQLLCQRCNGHKGKYCIDYRQQWDASANKYTHKKALFGISDRTGQRLD